MMEIINTDDTKRINAKMANDISMRRVGTRIKELFDGKIDIPDVFNGNAYHFETRALAAYALVMVTELEISQACSHVTDGYHDMGLDAIYLDEIQKKLFVVQSKWRSDGAGAIDQAEMCSFVEGVKRILNEDLGGANSKIMAKSMDIDRALTQMGYQIHAIFIHTGSQKANDYTARPMNQLINATNDDVSTILLFDEFDFRDVYSSLAKGQEQSSIDIDDVILSNWGKVNTPFKAYYGTISAAAIGEWYQKYGNSLFAKNIRFYKGNTEVNEGMKKVLLQEPENFYYYNNGLKLLCSSIDRKGKNSTTSEIGLFVLKGVSLVNGAQTTGTIGSVFLENQEQIAKAQVMIQIIDLSDVDMATSAQITRLSNTQNRIENKDFASLDPEQDRLRMELSFVHYSYLYKSGDVITNMDKQISFDEAIVSLACLNNDISYAVTAKRNVGALSEDITKVPYKVLFNHSTNSNVLLNSILCMRAVEKYLQVKKEHSNNNRERLACIHANRFLLHFVLQEIKKTPKFDTAVMDREILLKEVSEIVDEILPKIVMSMDGLYPDSYPANIFKNVKKCKEIEVKVNSKIT